MSALVRTLDRFLAWIMIRPRLEIGMIVLSWALMAIFFALGQIFFVVIGLIAYAVATLVAAIWIVGLRLTRGARNWK